MKLGSDEHLVGTRFLGTYHLVDREGMVGVFAEHMRMKLVIQSKRGYSGWHKQTKANKEHILSSLEALVVRQREGEHQTVDIANLAMMLYYYDYPKSKEG